MKFIFTIFLAALASSVISQQTKPNSQVLAAYNATEIEAMTDDQIFYLNFLAENLCIVSENAEKASSLPIFSFENKNGGTLTDGSAFNVLLYPTLQAGPTHQYYRIGETNWVIFVNSQNRMDELFKRYVAKHKK